MIVRKCQLLVLAGVMSAYGGIDRAFFDGLLRIPSRERTSSFHKR